MAAADWLEFGRNPGRRICGASEMDVFDLYQGMQLRLQPACLHVLGGELPVRKVVRKRRTCKGRRRVVSTTRCSHSPKVFTLFPQNREIAVLHPLYAFQHREQRISLENLLPIFDHTRPTRRTRVATARRGKRRGTSLRRRRLPAAPRERRPSVARPNLRPLRKRLRQRLREQMRKSVRKLLRKRPRRQGV